MSLKGKIQQDHMPRNASTFRIPGLPALTIVNIGAIEETLEVITLPDRTKASGGQRPPIEFSIQIPAHHTEEVAAMESWYVEAQAPTTAGYKKQGVLALVSLTGTTRRAYQVRACFPGGRGIPEQSMENEGEMNVLTYPIHASEIKPLSGA